jgi:hypothetical protein
MHKRTEVKKYQWTYGLVLVLIIGCVSVLSGPMGLAFLERLKPTKIEQPPPLPVFRLPFQQTQIVEKYVAAIERVYLNPRAYPTYNAYYQEVSLQIQAILRQIQDIMILEVLFYECYQKIGTVPLPTPKWLDPYAQATSAILRRLQEIHTEQAVAKLVDIFADEAVGFDGASSLNICSCIVGSGDIAVPYLSKVQNSRKQGAQEYIQMIREGWKFCS